MNYKYGKWLQKEMIQFPHQIDVDPEGMVVLQCALEISAEHSDSYISFEDFSVTTADNNVQSYAELIKKTLDEEYRNWIQELGDRYRTSQIKASIRVNNEMLMYYWSVGKDITERRADSKWGNKFFQNMSMDMSDMIPNAKGFSPTNLRYMMRFYGLYKDIVIVPQVGERLLENNGNQIVPQVEED